MQPMTRPLLPSAILLSGAISTSLPLLRHVRATVNTRQRSPLCSRGGEGGVEGGADSSGCFWLCRPL